MPVLAPDRQPTLSTRLLEVGSAFSSTQHDLVTLAARFEASNEWILDGAPSAAHWMADRLDVCIATAREWIRIGKALSDLPAATAALADGSLSFSKVRALTRIATAENEAELVDLAATIPAGRLGHALAAWTQRHEDPPTRDARHHRERSLRWRVEPDGMVDGTFRLPPGTAAALIAAVEATVMRTPPRVTKTVTSGANHATAVASSHPSLAQQRADALIDLITNGGATIEAEIVLHVRGDGCTMDDGTPVTDTIVDRLAPRAFLRALIHDAQSRPVNASTRRRRPTTRQQRVVKERDRRCIDCGSTDLLEYDHNPPHHRTGHTTTDELELRCAPCHRRRHAREDTSRG